MNAKYSVAFSYIIIAFLLFSILPAGASAAPDDITHASVASNKTFSNNHSSFIKLNLYPNIETIGVIVSGIDLPKTAELIYRQNNETNWHTGHPLMRIDDGRLVGSLFELLPSTSYSIKVVDGENTIEGLISTQPENLQFTPLNILHVDGDATPGGDGTLSSPFQNIQDGINHATPGTQVLVADGVYHEAITFPNSGNTGSWIQVKAKGSGAILDGSKNLSENIWKPHQKAKVWFTKVDVFFTYLARNEQRFFNYANLRSLLYEPKGDGWYLERSTMKLYVRSRDNPANHRWQVPHHHHTFDINNQDWIWIEGFEMQFYNSCGVCTENASHIVIRKNKIHNMQLGIYVNWTGGEERGNDTRIEYNEIYNPPVNEWRWSDTKGSSMEGTAIVLRGHRGAIVRGNELHNFFNGIYTGSSAASQIKNPELALDIDVYDNYIHHISDDALEPEGACLNHRFRNNTINSAFVGVSLAPVTMGPTWVLHSTFANYTGRGIKWAYSSNGHVLIYHNIFWTMASDITAMDFITPAQNTILGNNIFENNGYAIYGVHAGFSNHDWSNNNWHTAYTPPIKWENADYATITDLCIATGLACNSYEDYPGLTNPNAGDFTLNPSSPNIDRGAIISGINDGFNGTAPDIGAYESTFADTPSPTLSPTPTTTPESTITTHPEVIEISRIDSNPTSANNVTFSVLLSEAVTGVDMDDFSLIPTGNISGAVIRNISGSENSYALTVFTGNGEGTLHLDALDNDSIINITGNPLGGKGVGNGNFHTGKIYTIDKKSPIVTAILRSNPNPTTASNLSFKVGFTEAVYGVDASDFSIQTTGDITGALITNISGSENMYTITLRTGNGNGTLGLAIIDNDSILDALGNPLGGAGVSNGNFTLSEKYTINKIPQQLTTKTFRSNGKNDGWILESSENSNQGDKINDHASTLVLGDNHLNGQFRSILHFSTHSLPNDAIITDAMILLKSYDMTGTNPFFTHQNILVDIQYGAFGFIGPFQHKALQSSDFQSPSCLDSAGIIQNTPMGNWYWAFLDRSALDCINRYGNTQFRLQFQTDDNNNLAYDYLRFYSGDNRLQDRPRLIIKYYKK